MILKIDEYITISQLHQETGKLQSKSAIWYFFKTKAIEKKHYIVSPLDNKILITPEGAKYYKNWLQYKVN